MRKLFSSVWRSLLNPDGRRALAFLALLGASGVMTSMVSFVLWMVRGNATYVFYLGLAAHAQLAICITGFMALFVKRHVEIGKQGVKLKDLSDEVEEEEDGRVQ